MVVVYEDIEGKATVTLESGAGVSVWLKDELKSVKMFQTPTKVSAL